MSLVILKTPFFPHKCSLLNLKHVWEQGYQANCLKCSRLIPFMLFSTECLIVNDSSYWSLACINNFFSISMNHTWRKKKKNCNRFFVQRLMSLFFSSNVICYFEKAYKTKRPGMKWNYANSNKSKTFKILCWSSYFPNAFLFFSFQFV